MGPVPASDGIVESAFPPEAVGRFRKGYRRRLTDDFMLLAGDEELRGRWDFSRLAVTSEVEGPRAHRIQTRSILCAV